MDMDMHKELDILLELKNSNQKRNNKVKPCYVSLAYQRSQKTQKNHYQKY